MTPPDARTAENPMSMAHEDPSRWAPRLDRLLDEMQALYVELDGLSAQQGALIDAADTDALLGVLGERQRVVAQLEGAGERFDPFRRRWEELMSALDAARREAFAVRVKRLMETIGRISERDDRDRKALEQQRMAVTDEMASLSRGRSAMAAYGGGRAAPGGAQGPMYQDRQG